MYFYTFILTYSSRYKIHVTKFCFNFQGDNHNTCKYRCFFFFLTFMHIMYFVLLIACIKTSSAEKNGSNEGRRAGPIDLLLT